MGDQNANANASTGTRLRVSVWAGAHLVTAANMAFAKGICDDISILKTIGNNTNPKDPTQVGPFTVALDSATAHGAQTLNDFFRDVIRACHDNDIQCLAGYDLAADGPMASAFNDWLFDLNLGRFAGDPPVETARVAGDIVGVINTDFAAGTAPAARFDGISFDIESIRDVASKDVLSGFYQEVAEQLRNTTGDDADKFVGIATAGMVDDTSSTTKGTGAAPKNGQATLYSMVDGNPNLVIRPMAYDNFPLTLLDAATGAFTGAPASTVTQWHNDIMDYAQASPRGVNAPAVPVEQFELGIKIFVGTNNKPTKIPKRDATGSMVDGSGNPVTRLEDAAVDHFEVSNIANFDSVMDNDVEIRRRCRELRKRGMGLVIFALFSGGLKGFWDRVRTFDWVLNATVEPPAAFDTDPTPTGDPNFDPSVRAANITAAGTKGAPRQQPHTDASLKRLHP